MGYNLISLSIECRATDNHANADCLSQLPLEATTEEDAITKSAIYNRLTVYQSSLLNLQQMILYFQK